MDDTQKLTTAFYEEKRLYPDKNKHLAGNSYDLKISAKGISGYLFGCTLCLVVAHLSAFIIGYVTKSTSVWLIYFQFYFNMENENNVPTFFSSILLLLAAVILLFIRAIETTNKVYWLSLSGIFLFLALDEALEIHEKVNLFAKKYITGNIANYLNLPWVLPYALIFVIAGLFFFKFLKTLPGKTQRAIVVTGSIYVLAAGGIEIIDGLLFKYFSYSHIIFRLTSFTQETLEIVGIILFIRSLVEFIQSKFQKISISAK